MSQSIRCINNYWKKCEYARLWLPLSIWRFLSQKLSDEVILSPHERAFIFSRWNTQTFKKVAAHQCFAAYWLLSNLQSQESQEGLLVCFNVVQCEIATAGKTCCVLRANALVLETAGCLGWWFHHFYADSSPHQKLQFSRYWSEHPGSAQPFLARRGSGSVLKRFTHVLGDVPCPGLPAWCMQ